MAKIAIAIMLIFIASTHCALRDCSKEELVEIATLVKNAVLKKNGLVGFVNFDAYEDQELVREIKEMTKNGGEDIQIIAKNYLLSINKLHVYPVFEVLLALSKEDLIKVCQKVEKFARTNNKLFVGGLMSNFNEYSWIGTIVEALRSFAESWKVSNETILNLAFEVNAPALYEAATVKLNINFLKALASGLLKVFNENETINFKKYTPKKIVEYIQNLIQNMLNDFPEILLAMTDVKGWEILANSEKLKRDELIKVIQSKYKIF